jgi:hypothetical protein
MMDARAVVSLYKSVWQDRHTKDNSKQAHILSPLVKSGDLGLTSAFLLPKTNEATDNDQHATTEDPSTSHTTDRSSKDQDPHIGCYTTNERSKLKDENGKDDNMF